MTIYPKQITFLIALEEPLILAIFTSKPRPKLIGLEEPLKMTIYPKQITFLIALEEPYNQLRSLL